MHRNIILSVVLYGCETWSLKLGEEHRRRVLESRVLWEQFQNLYCVPDVISMAKLRRACITHGVVDV
jgi:hypothetical protein